MKWRRGGGVNAGGEGFVCEGLGCWRRIKELKSEIVEQGGGLKVGSGML